MTPTDQTPRTALVTGSARRVGRAIAARLVAERFTVFVHAREADRARAAAVDLGAAGGFGADLADARQVEGLATQVVAACGERLDLLVNSASTFVRTEPWEHAGPHAWADAFRVNARAPYLLTSALVSALEAAGGAVVNISDHAARDAWPSYPLHAASKAALESLTRSGAAALADRGIRVNAVVPGTIMVPDGVDPASVPGGARADANLAAFLEAVVDLATHPDRTGEVRVLPG